MNEWKSVGMFCPNCGRKVTGYLKKGGEVKIECSKCHCIILSRRTEKRRINITLYENINDQMSETTNRVAAEKALSMQIPVQVARDKFVLK